MREEEAKTKTKTKTKCKWYQFHDFSKWEDLQERENVRFQPVLVQERRCKRCNHAERKAVTL